MAKVLIASALAMAAASQAVPRGIVFVRAETDVKALIEGVNTAFAAFKTEHTKQLDAIKAGLPTGDITAKVEKIGEDVTILQAAIDEANIKIAAAAMNGGASAGLKDKEYTESFQAHMKKGEIQASLNKGAADEGGYLAPVEWDRTITDKLVQVSPIRQLATVQTIGTAGFKKLYNNRGMVSGWVGEKSARPETGTPTFGSLDFIPGEIYANPAATQQMLDDAEINLETWLAGEVQVEFAFQEGVAFVSGDGANKPFGFLTYATGGANAARHPWGAIAVSASGAAVGVTADAIIDLVYSLPSEYSANASFTMNRKTQGIVRKLKDGQGNYLWQPSYVAGQPSTLSGHPLHEVADMPDVAANALSIGFGDYKRGYLIVDRAGVRVLRDPFSNKPYVQFYTTKRVGGGVNDPGAIKLMKINAA